MIFKYHTEVHINSFFTKTFFSSLNISSHLVAICYKPTRHFRRIFRIFVSETVMITIFMYGHEQLISV